MALPLARLLLPALPACRCQPPPRFPTHHAAARRGCVSFVVPATAYYSRGNRAACAASASVAPAPAAPAPAAEAEGEAEEPVGPRTRLVAQNIPWDCTADDMRALFEKHGSVAHVELSMYNSGKNRGLAFVTMGSEEEALAALNNLNSTILNDRKIKVDFARARKKQPKQPVSASDPNSSKHIVFVGNLTWRVRSRHLRELFESTSGFLSAEVIFQTTTPRRSAGYAFVSFSSKETAESAISTFNGKKLMGRPINVMFKDDDAKKNKSSVPKEEELDVESSEQSGS
uniref:RRM domain-containing protein n=1 Tax=Arundo donax TaxID=35708 RepID=A0A0A9G627_ARUDO